MEAEVKEWKITDIFERNVDAGTRFVFNEGGTRSSKTISILQVLHRWCEKNPNFGLIISVVSETMPHLRRGAMLDYFDRLLKPYGLYDEKRHNKTDNSYMVFGNKIEFFSADSSDKVHGPGRHILFFNEIQNTNYETFFHLAQRTELVIYADWNPTHEFFIHNEYLNNPEYKEDITYIHSTYKDNPFLSQGIIDDILKRANRDINYKRIYVEGLLGFAENVVFPKFTQVDIIPQGFTLLCYGLDFGYTNDPTALVGIHINKEKTAICVDEIIYSTGLMNNEIGRIMLDNGIRSGYDEVFADWHEPKSIDEIRRASRINVKSAFDKSVIYGISLIQQYDILVTKSSVNLIKELRNYTYITDKDGKITNKTIGNFNHCIDAIRYGCIMKLKKEHIPVKWNF